MPQLPESFYFTGHLEYTSFKRGKDGTARYETHREYRNHSEMPLEFASDELKERLRERWDAYWLDYDNPEQPNARGIPADQYPTYQEVLDDRVMRQKLIETHYGYARGSKEYNTANRYLELVGEGKRPGTSSKYAGLIELVKDAVYSGRGIVGVLEPIADGGASGFHEDGEYGDMMAEMWADIFEDYTGYESSLYPA